MVGHDYYETFQKHRALLRANGDGRSRVLCLTGKPALTEITIIGLNRRAYCLLLAAEALWPT